MIDVMMILLVFFMVTSTYLDLDAIALSEGTDRFAVGGGGPEGSTVLLRLGADGRTYLRGRPLDAEALGGALAERAARDPGVRVVLLASGAARTQDLVRAMETATLAGIRSLRLVRPDAP